MLAPPRRPGSGPLLTAAAAGLLAFALAGCGREGPDTSVNGAAADAGAAVNRVADQAQDAVTTAGHKAEAAANTVTAKTEAAVERAAPKAKEAADVLAARTKEAVAHAKPKAEALARQVERRAEGLADATGVAANKAGRAVSAAGARTDAELHRRTTHAERSAGRSPENE